MTDGWGREWTEWQPLASENIESGRYCETHRALQLRFLKGAQLYEYNGVEPETWEGLLMAVSPTGFFLREIVGRAQYRSVKDEFWG